MTLVATPLDAAAADARVDALVIGLGRAFHQAGLPSDSIEHIMRDTAHHFAVPVQVNALPTSLMVAMGASDHQRLVILRLEPGRLHLERLSVLNDLFDGVLSARYDLVGALTRLTEIETSSLRRPPGVSILGFLLLSLGVALLLGGGPREIAVASIIGVTTGILAAVAARNVAVERLFETLAAFVATLVIAGAQHVLGPIAVYIVIIAGIVQLLPGLTLTTALHELANKNLVAGTARLGGFLVTLLSLGCGVALGIAVLGPSIIQGTAPPRGSVGPLLVPAVVAIASAIVIILNARIRDFGWILGSCAVTIVAARLLGGMPGFQVATFGAAFVVGVITTIGSRFLRVPQAVLLVPGLYVLVPGSLSYESVLFIFNQRFADAATVAVNSVLASVFIVAGLLLSQLLFPQMHTADEARRA
jgi:uncharacterized membrane protein YjjP (DUF1212 family)